MKDINNSFQFQKIIIASSEEKSGRVLKIYPRTLITSKNNTIGKSTLLNCLFWGLGCEVRFEEDWGNLDTSTLIVFSINNREYSVKRDQRNIYLLAQPDGRWEKFDKITGDYLDKLNKILNFNILLKANRAQKLIRVPPAFYFSATYIEQMNGWIDIWNSFNNLGQFNKNDKLEISKYMCSIQDINYYENKLIKNSYELKNIDISKKIENNKSIMQFFSERSTSSPIQEMHRTSREYINIENSIQNMRKKYIAFTSRKSHIENEINIINMALSELHEDYIYAVENLENTIVYCPTCGIEHKNDLVNRFSIISDSDKLKLELSSLKTEKLNIEKNLLSLSKATEDAYNNIANFSETSESVSTLNEYLFTRSVQPSLEKEVINLEGDIKKNKKNISEINKINKSIQHHNLEKVEESIVDYFNKLCSDLDIKILRKNSLNEILDFGGGGANQIKAMLAKRLTILNAIHNHGELATPPLIIDSPRQQDVDNNNYNNMLKMLVNETPLEVQLIIAAVKNNFTEAIEHDFEEIVIDTSLLLKEEYHLALFELDLVEKNLNV